MALFGVQLVVTMIAAFLLQKLSPYFSVAKYLFSKSGLTYYAIPDTVDPLTGAAASSRSKKKRPKCYRRDPSAAAAASTVTIMKRDIPQPAGLPVVWGEVWSPRHFDDLVWPLDFSTCTLLVYMVTEVYRAVVVSGRNEMNVSLLWCTMAAGLSVRVLASLTRARLVNRSALSSASNSGSGGRSSSSSGGSSSSSGGSTELCLMAGLAYFLLAMVVLVARDQLLELQLLAAYDSFNSSATAFLQLHGHQSSAPASLLAFRLLLAVWSGFIGAIFVFPSLAFTRMYRDCIRMPSCGWLTRTGCHVAFLLPLLCLLMWCRPLARVYLTETPLPSLNRPLLSDACFESARVWLLLLCVLVRCVMAPPLIQAYLAMAPARLQQLRNEAGRILLDEVHTLMYRVYSGLYAAILQLLAPMLLTVYLTLMYKTLGGHSWWGSELLDPPAVDHARHDQLDDAESMSRHVTLTLTALKQVFTRELFNGVLGYAVWWNCFVMFTTSLAAIGMLDFV